MNNTIQNQLFSINHEVFKNEVKNWIKEAITEMNEEANTSFSSKEANNGFLDSKQASKFLNISVSSLNALQKQGFIKPYKLNRKQLYKESELIEAMERKRGVDATETERNETKAELFLKSMKARQQSRK